VATTHVHDGLPYEDETPADEPAAGATGWWELVALLVLVIGGAGLPVVGWITGIAMVHQSHVWTRRDMRIALLAPVPAVAAVVIWAAVDDQAVLLHLGPLAVLVVFGGAIAGLLGGAYLTVRAFVLA
jgi:hypothetical protein